MMLVDMENAGITVFPTHRILRNLKWFDYFNIVDRMKEHFDVVPSLNREKGEVGLAEAYKNGRHAFVFFVGNNNYTLLTLKNPDIMREYLPNATDSERALDVNILHKLILERFFGIDAANMSEQENLNYTRIADEALAEVDGQRATCSFLMNPTRVSDIVEISSSGGKMPQKSTYFFPKIMTGLVMNQIFKDED
jgi:uncharacterized protein (DUF1015 family)